MSVDAPYTMQTSAKPVSPGRLPRGHLAGSDIAATPKQLSPKYLYDERGSELFEPICELPEYYPTRAEVVDSRKDRPGAD